MNALVTGGLGFIGHNLISELDKHGGTTVVYDNCTNYGIIPQDELDYLIHERKKVIGTNADIYEMNILQPSMFDYIMPKYNIDTIVHLASFPRQKVVNQDPGLASSVMIGGLLNLLEAAKKFKVKKFVFVSSSMVYGQFEDNTKEDHLCRPQGPYGIMKLTGEELVKDYSQRGYFNYVIIRPSAVYGPLDVEDRVIARFLLSSMRNRTLKVNGAGERLDFTYVEDTARGIAAACLSERACNKTYNITRSQSFSLLEAAELVISITGKGSIQVCDKDNDFPSRGFLNIDAARGDFGYQPRVDLYSGLSKYHDWIAASTYWQNKLS